MLPQLDTTKDFIFRCCVFAALLSYSATAFASSLDGERLFNDQRLSADERTACSTCHVPAHGFADPRPVSSGAFNQRGSRNAPSLLNLDSRNALFWDGRRASIEELLLDPLTHPREHGLSEPAAVLKIVRKYYKRADARPIAMRDVVSSLAAYVNSLSSHTSDFDRFVGGESSALTESQRRGLQLFTGRAQCATCHTVDDGAFSDGLYHAGQLAPNAQERLGGYCQLEQSRS